MTPARLRAVYTLPAVMVLAAGAALVGRSAAMGGPRDARASAPTASLASRIQAHLEPFVKGGNFTGVVLVAHRGTTVFARGYGWANAEWRVPNSTHTLFHIASVSKTFTAAAILLLQEDGKLDVTQPLSTWIPDYPRGGEITLEHLLAHRSGVPNVNDLPEYDARSRLPQSLDATIALFERLPLDFAPGQQYAYSNSNYNLLALVIEKASGMPFGEFLERRVFSPAGMTATRHDGRAGTLIPERAAGYVPAGLSGFANAPAIDWSIKTGNGSVVSTAEDLLKWDRALYGNRVLQQASREMMFTRRMGGVGYGWFVGTRQQRLSIRMTGRSPGFTTSLERFPDSEWVVIVLSNSYASVSQDLAADVAALVFGGTPSTKPLQPSRPDRAVLERHAGRYQLPADYYVPSAIARITAAADHLVLSYPGVDDDPLVPQADGTFVDRLFWGRVRFEGTAGGRSQRLRLAIGREFVAPRVEDPPRP